MSKNQTDCESTGNPYLDHFKKVDEVFAEIPVVHPDPEAEEAARQIFEQEN
jgi:hypothetical protein